MSICNVASLRRANYLFSEKIYGQNNIADTSKRSACFFCLCPFKSNPKDNGSAMHFNNVGWLVEII